MGDKAFNYQEIKKLNRRQTEAARSRIQVSKIVDQLQAFVMGEIELDGSKVKAAEILLNKTLPALSASELTAVVEDKRSATQETIDLITTMTRQAKEKAELTIQ